MTHSPTPDVNPPQAPAEVSEPATSETPPTTTDSAELALQVEAALMVTDRPLPTAKLAEMLGQSGKSVTRAVGELNKVYQQTGRSFRIEAVAGGWQILTLAAFGSVTTAVARTRAAGKLSPAAMETLAIIAYKQPILRVDVEAIRGVACGEVLRSLMERKLVKIVGRAEELGRPMLYGTTKKFLEMFGLGSLKDLPQAEQWLGGAGGAGKGNTEPSAVDAEPSALSGAELPEGGVE